MKKIIFCMCALLATTMLAKADDCNQTEITGIDCGSTITVKLTATPATGKYLTGWKDGDGNVISLTSDGTYEIEDISKNMQFIAQFGDQYKITISCTNGKISINGEEKENGDYYYDPNTAITLKAIPANCYEFEKWGTGETTDELTFNLTGNSSFSANCNIKQFKVSVSASDNTSNVCVTKE